MVAKYLNRVTKKIFCIKFALIMSVFIFMNVLPTYAQFSAVKVNLVGLATTNINVSVDLQINKKTTFNVPVSMNPFSFGQTQFKHILVQPGFRLWKYENYIGHFCGIYTTAAKYKTSYKGNSADGYLCGVGASYGYSILLTTRWSLEFEIGVSIIYAEYDLFKNDIGVFDDEIIAHHRKIGLYPSKSCVSFSYLF